MDLAIDMTAIEARLRTGDIGVQHEALMEIIGAVEKLMETAIQGFRHTKTPLMYADHLARFGNAIVPRVESLYRSYEHGSGRTNLAILLLYFGNKSGLPDVMSALQIDNESQFLAASKLANAGIAEAREPITQLLRDHVFGRPLDHTAGPKIGVFLGALTKLGAEIPNDVRQRLTGPDCSKYVTAYLPPSGS
jgi:hypothetical protein